MAQENWQKYKLLKLLELLRQETDEQNPLTTSALCSKLAEMGISCERRTLTKDIAVLNELGYEGLRIKHNALGSQNGCRGAFLRSFEKFIVLWYNLFEK